MFLLNLLVSGKAPAKSNYYFCRSRGGAQSDGARRAFGAAAGRGNASPSSRWYGASDSEREQPGWRVSESTSLAAECALRKQCAAGANKDDTGTDTDTDTSARGTDDDSLLESIVGAARRTTRARPGYRRWRRPERGGRSGLGAVQRRWDAAMAMPLVSGNDDPPLGSTGGDDDDDVGGVTDARGRGATDRGAVAGAKRSRRAAMPPGSGVTGGGFNSRLTRRTVRFGDGLERAVMASVELDVIGPKRRGPAGSGRVQKTTDVAPGATIGTETARAPRSEGLKRKRRGARGRRDVDGAAAGGARGQNMTAPLEEAAAAGVTVGGGTRGAEREAERVMTSELDARKGSSASPGIQIGAGGRRTAARSRQRERWIARLNEMVVLPKGEERAAALRSLGAQRQRADAYAAAAARPASGRGNEGC